MQIKSSSVNRKMNTTAWLGAVIICFQYICAAIAIPRISIILAFTIILVVIYQLINRQFAITASFLAIVIYIILVFLISFLVVNKAEATLDYFARFVLYDIAALLIGFQIKEKEEIIKRVAIIGLIGLPFLLTSNIITLNTANRMGYAYACLPILVASVLGLVYEKKIKIICAINIFAIFIKLLAFAPRGVWVVIATAIVASVYWRLCVNNNRGTKFVTSVAILMLLFGGALYLFYNLEVTVTALNEFLVHKFNIRIYAFDKYLRYLAQDKLYNGRDYLWNLAVSAIGSSPVIGHGIGYFEGISSGSYCHNILLQSFCEAGVFFGIPVIVYIGRQLVRIVRSPFLENRESFHWLILVFCVGIEMLLFSSVYWSYSLFWFFLGSCLHDVKQRGVQNSQ
jgi:hypothetical protein